MARDARWLHAAIITSRERCGVPDPQRAPLRCVTVIRAVIMTDVLDAVRTLRARAAQRARYLVCVVVDSVRHRTARALPSASFARCGLDRVPLTATMLH